MVLKAYHVRVKEDTDLEEWAKAHNTWFSVFVHPQEYVVIASSPEAARKLVTDSQDSWHKESIWWTDLEVTEVVELDLSSEHIVMANEPTG